MATKTRKCTGCKKRFDQSIVTWREAPCGYFHDSDCQIDYARKQGQKLRTKKDKQKRADFRKKQVDVKGLRHWIKETQKVVNAYVRQRDKGKPCISCGIYEHQCKTKSLRGSVWDAGHYKTTKARPEIRFDMRNINGQCKSCNQFHSGRIKDQEVGIVERYGQERLDWLLSYHKPKHYTIEYLERLRRVLRKRMRTRGE